MDAERFNAIKRLLIALEEIPAAERSAYLDRACAGDELLRLEVESLLTDTVPSIMLTGGLAAKVTPLIGAAPHDTTAVGSEIGPYQLVEVLGEGGMGVVYRAEQRVPIQREVALKLVRRGMDSERIVSRFESERQALAMMEHPNIARVFDAGAGADGRPYFVMELVRGEPITELCTRERPPLTTRLRLFLQVCDAIQHAHQKGIIHRDLKPSNVLLTRQGTEFVPKVIDFGIAKAIGESAAATPLNTMAGQIVGTPEYMSPEQAGLIDAALVDTRTDVYSLGVILYELVSGRRPYELSNRSPIEIDRALRTPPKPPSKIEQASGSAPIANRAQATDIDAVALMAMEREPGDRYGSVEQLADDVRRVIEHRPVRARTQTLRYRASRFVRRHAIGVTSAVAIAMLLLGSGVAIVRERNRAVASEARAIRETQRAQAEAAKASEVSRFLVDLFRESDPAVSRGASVTARELLDRGAQRLATELSTQDEIRAALMDTIGVVYRLLGLFIEAQTLALDALTTRRRVLGPEHVDVATSLDNLGQIARDRSEFDVSERYHRDAVDMRRKLLGPRHASVGQSLSNLSLTLHERGQYDEAERLGREALEIRRETLGASSPEVLNSLSNLGSIEIARGRMREAEAIYREVVDGRRKLFPAGHPHIARSLSSLGSVLGQSGRLTEGEPLFREALAIRRKAHPADHPEVSNSASGLANLLHDMGRLDEAEPLYREALAINRRLLGDWNMDVAVDLNNLASLLEDRGRLSEATKLFYESLAIRRKVLGPNHLSVANILNNLGRLHFSRTEPAEAERVLRSAIEIRETLKLADHPRQATTLTWLGRVRESQGDLVDAERRFRAAVAIVRRVQKEGGPETAATILSLGHLLVRQGKAGEAEPFLREAHEWRRKSLPSGHRGISEAEGALGECLLRLSRFADAEPLLLSALKVVPPARGIGLFDRPRVLGLLVSLYDRTGRPDAAARYRAGGLSQ